MGDLPQPDSYARFGEEGTDSIEVIGGQETKVIEFVTSPKLTKADGGSLLSRRTTFHLMQQYGHDQVKIQEFCTVTLGGMSRGPSGTPSFPPTRRRQRNESSSIFDRSTYGVDWLVSHTTSGNHE